MASVASRNVKATGHFDPRSLRLCCEPGGSNHLSSLTGHSLHHDIPWCPYWRSSRCRSRIYQRLVRSSSSCVNGQATASVATDCHAPAPKASGSSMAICYTDREACNAMSARLLLDVFGKSHAHVLSRLPGPHKCARGMLQNGERGCADLHMVQG